MANTIRKKAAVKHEEPKKKKNNNKSGNNVVINSMRKFISGDYLFSKNIWRSPLWFVLYVVVLILIIVGIRFVPVRKYEETKNLKEELKRVTVNHHKNRAIIDRMTTPEALIKDFSNNDVNYADVIVEPTVIKVVNSNGKNK
ncbi:hypothetical protein LJC30_02550 [Odoribacter sp. OttesenSCG-928-L07]|nr:hypothetical protein [Odoribacter sp. OttesenSCG-928-L07]MDL2240540.1 hypothetical protein [Bacteroidales bacterium OttesenSCG-928-K22]